MRSIKLVEKSLDTGTPTCPGELKEFGRSSVMLALITALNATRGTFCLAQENRAVGGKSKSGAITTTNTTAIKSKPMHLPQQFIVTTRDNSMFRRMSVCQNTEKPASLACFRRQPPLTHVIPLSY